MDKYEELGEPTKVMRDAGYSKIKSISPKNKREIQERIENPNIVTGNYKLKELFSKRGITVIPDKMTMWYQFTE
ncbi:MAG: hypothetical protein IJ287_09760 [Methanobrevibacter sp.]|nr:hypothetical protein [Methanobrevibacter sp.]